MSDCARPVAIGEGRVLRKGGDAAIIAIGTMVRPSLEAAGLLAGDGIEAAVFDARFLKPLDAGATVSLVRGAKAVFTVEENSCIGGLGDAVALRLSMEGVETPVSRIGIPDLFVPHGERGSLLDEIGLTAVHIAETVRGHLSAAEKGSEGGYR